MLEDFIEKFEKLYIIIILCNMELSIFRRNGNQYFSCDESEFSHDINSESIWVLGITNNTTKDFRVVATKSMDTIHLKEFITKYISFGNKIIIDGWAAMIGLIHQIQDILDIGIFTVRMIWIRN